MPPEQAIGAVDQIDERSDVFGLGAVLCVILTGWPPFVANSAESTRQLAAQGKLDAAFARLDSCAAEPELVALCKKCLAADQNERPSRANPNRSTRSPKPRPPASSSSKSARDSPA
jgi:hypothetical protein